MKILLLIFSLSTCISFGEENVGMIKKLTFELAGAKLKAAEVDEKSPALVRMIDVVKTTKGWKYELDFIGQEPGQYNVVNFLRTSTDQKPVGYKEVKVTVGTTLDASFKGELSKLQLKQKSPSTWYTKLNWVLCTVWFIILAVIIFVRRKKPVKKLMTIAKIETAGEKLLALLSEEDASSKENWQKIEGLFITHFFQQHDEKSLTVHEKLMSLKKDSIVGPLISLLETYLHAPNGKERVKLSELKQQISLALEDLP